METVDLTGRRGRKRAFVDDEAAAASSSASASAAYDVEDLCSSSDDEAAAASSSASASAAYDVEDLCLSGGDEAAAASSSASASAAYDVDDLCLSGDDEAVVAASSASPAATLAAAPAAAAGLVAGQPAAPPVVIVTHNINKGLSPKTGKNQDKLLRVEGQLSDMGLPPDILFVQEAHPPAEVSVKGNTLPSEDYEYYATRVWQKGEGHGNGVAVYVRKDSPLAEEGVLLPQQDWDPFGQFAAWSCASGVFASAYLPTPTKKNALHRATLDANWPGHLRGFGDRLLLFCGDLNVVRWSSDEERTFSGQAYDNSRKVFEDAIQDAALADIVRPSEADPVVWTSYQVRGPKNGHRARCDHALVPEAKKELVDRVFVPDHQTPGKWVVESAEHPGLWQGDPATGLGCGSDHVPIVISMRLPGY